MKNLLRLAVAAAATAVIAAVTFVSSVKLAESVEKSLEENDKKEDDMICRVFYLSCKVSVPVYLQCVQSCIQIFEFFITQLHC